MYKRLAAINYSVITFMDLILSTSCLCVTHRGGHVLLQVLVFLLEAKVFCQEILVARSLVVQLRLQLLSLLCDGTGHFL